MSNRDFKRVTRSRPCRICGKPDWCGYIDEDLAICMRVPSDRETTNGGWKHGEGHWPRGVPFLPEPRKPRVPDFDATRWWKDRILKSDEKSLLPLSRNLKVSIEALQNFGCVREGGDFAFPMRNGASQIIGIRFRSLDGSQWAKTGSRAGLFLPIRIGWLVTDPVYICEGGSDAMAGYDLGLHTVGRPSALGQEDLVKDYLFAMSARDKVIIADNDEPGQRGAEKLKQVLGGKVPILTLPTKDLREFKNGGGTRELIESMVRRIAY